MIPRFRPILAFGDLLGLAVAAPAPLEAMERAFAARYGFGYARWFPYARVGVVCYLESLGSRGKAVLSPFNCVALGNGIARAGFAPVYVDTEKDGFNQDADTFLEALEHRADVGIVVSLWGIRTSVESRAPLGKPILYDFALRGLDMQRPVLGTRDAVLYSLGWGKPVNGLGGAMLCTDDAATAAAWSRWQHENLVQAPRRKPAAAALVRTVAFHPWVFGAAAYLFERWELGSGLLGHADREKLLPTDWRSMPSRAQEQRTLKSLDALDRLMAERAEQIEWYQGGLRDVPFVTLPPAERHLSHFAVRVPERDRVVAEMRSRGVFCSSRLFDRLLCDYPWLRGESTGDLRRARELTLNTLHLPLYPGMRRGTAERVIHALAATGGTVAVLSG